MLTVKRRNAVRNICTNYTKAGIYGIEKNRSANVKSHLLQPAESI